MVQPSIRPTTQFPPTLQHNPTNTHPEQQRRQPQQPQHNNNNNNNNNDNNYRHNNTTQWPNIFIQSDGGCRYQGSSSTGWRIMAKYNDTTETIIEGGTLHPTDMCSFSIECVALNEALREMINKCENAISIPVPPVVLGPPSC